MQECSEAQEWIGEQMATAASEDYGLDVEHVDTLQQAFDNFLTQLHGNQLVIYTCSWEVRGRGYMLCIVAANEGRIEAVCEAGGALLEDNAPEADRVRQRIDDIRGLWDDLKELAVARQEVRDTAYLCLTYCVSLSYSLCCCAGAGGRAAGARVRPARGGDGGVDRGEGGGAAAAPPAAPAARAAG